MGLTISYTLSHRGELGDEVLYRLVEHTANLASRIGCAKVSGPILGGPDHWNLSELPDGSTTGDPIGAIEGFSVSVLPGEGCETADFGLCRYEGVEGWRLSSWCKTQYAVRHGVDHFLRCHLRMVSLLDLWRSFGVTLDVCDEGEYWEHRSINRLRERMTQYERMIAAVAGTLKDDFEEQGISVQAEIFDHAQFERIEAEGRVEFTAQLAELQRLIRGRL
jgi:hypothetical protein